MSPKLVIGLAGPNGAGKGEVSSLLRDMGFQYLSLSDVVRQEAARRGEEPVRDVLIRIGRELRRAKGPGALAEMIRDQIEPPAVVDSIRNPGEVAVLRGLPGFFLLGVTAPEGERFRRLQERARPGDPETFEEFREKERIENSPDREGQQISATLALSDRVVDNESTMEVLAAKVRHAVEELEAAARRGTRDRAGEED